ncbi:MAG: hypothetical protein RL346_779 [Verrucomicrobiota bacterium]|jgi:hypothetical protein
MSHALNVELPERFSKAYRSRFEMFARIRRVAGHIRYAMVVEDGDPCGQKREVIQPVGDRGRDRSVGSYTLQHGLAV